MVGLRVGACRFVATLLTLLALALPGCSRGGGSSGGGGAPVGFAVTANTPAAGATGVALSATVTVTFSKDVDTATLVDGTTFTVTVPGPITLTGVLTYDGPSRTVTWTPSAALDPGVVHTVSLTAGILATDASPLFPATFDFTTTSLGVVSTSPADAATNVAVTAVVTVTFDADVNAATLVDGSTFTVTTPGPVTLTGTITYDNPSRTATWTPPANLDPAVTHTVTLTSGIEAVDGSPLIPHSFGFTTVSFTVTGTVPPDAATGVATSSTIMVTFSADVDDLTLVDGSTFVVTAQALGTISGTIAYDVPSRTATYTPSAALTDFTHYTVDLTAGVQAMSGLALTPFSFTFTTGGTGDATPPVFAGIQSAGADNAFRVNVSWNAAADNFDPPGSISYRVYRDGSPVTTTAPGVLTFTDTTVLGSTMYVYRVTAIDSSANEDANMVTLGLTTPAQKSWATDVYPLMSTAPATVSCTGCHGASGGLSLTSAAIAYGDLVNVQSNLDGG